MSKIIDKKKFYLIPKDDRDLNYEKYFEKGNKIEELKEYNSHNTYQLSPKEVATLLNKYKVLESFID